MSEMLVGGVIAVPRRVARASQVIAYPDTLRTSERGTLNRCRQRWSWSYNDRLRLKREAPALRFGTLIHRALEHYYGDQNQARRRPIHPAKTFLRLFDEELEETQKTWSKWKDEDDEWHTYRHLGEVMLEGYVNHFGPTDNEYLVLAVEQRFATPIRIPRGEPALVAPSPVTYVGTLDRILYHLPTRRLLFGDYKTTKNDPTKNAHLALDEQAGAYWAYGPDWLLHEAPLALRKQIFSKVQHLPKSHRKAIEEFHFDGIMYDFLQKKLPDDRPTNAQGYALNQDGSVSKRQQGPLFGREPAFRDAGDRRRVLRRIYEDAKEIGMMRQGQLAIKKSPDRFICIGCPFIDMCELHEGQHDWEAFRDGMYEDWDPYSTYYVDWDELE